jgi:hypothetical protein
MSTYYCRTDYANFPPSCCTQVGGMLRNSVECEGIAMAPDNYTFVTRNIRNCLGSLDVNSTLGCSIAPLNAAAPLFTKRASAVALGTLFALTITTGIIQLASF